jgi:MFS family permease
MAFALSALLVAFGGWVRSGVAETPAFTQLKSQRTTSQAPIREVASHHLRPLLTSIGARVGPDVAYALLVVFTLTYTTTILHLGRSLALTATLVGAACNAVGIPVFASWSDRVGRRPVYALGALLMMLWAFAYFRLMDSRQPLYIGIAVAIGLILHACMYGPQAAFIAEQFPARVRYAGSSMAYTLTGVVAGGVAPLLLSALYRAYGSSVPLSFYVTAALAVTLLALWQTRETANAPLQ